MGSFKKNVILGNKLINMRGASGSIEGILPKEKQRWRKRVTFSVAFNSNGRYFSRHFSYYFNIIHFINSSIDVIVKVIYV